MNGLWLIGRSLRLDAMLFQFPSWSTAKKASFVVMKYRLIAKHWFTEFRLGQSHVNWAGETIFYDSKMGLVGYQSMLTRPLRLLRWGKVADVKTVIDCGANVGLFTKMIRLVYPRADVFAIEPVPTTFEALRLNTAGDPKVATFQIAMSDRPGRGKMEFDPDDSAISRISKRGSLEVSVSTLDHFTATNGIGTVDILKIDAESHEAHVLRGAGDTLARTRYLLLEVTLSENDNYTLASLMGLLSSARYDFQLLAFRNYADRADGPMPIMDCLMENTHLTRP